MPEQTSNTINSSSDVLYDDNDLIQDEKVNDHAKFFDKSPLAASPPPMSTGDTSVTHSSLVESDYKSDMSAVMKTLRESENGSCKKIKELSTEIDGSQLTFTTCEQKSSHKADTKVSEDSIIKRKSSGTSHVETIQQQEEIFDRYHALPRPLQSSATSSSTASTNNISTEFELHPLPPSSTTGKSFQGNSSSKDSLNPSSKNIFQQPSFSDLQDEYFHEMITRIGSNIVSDESTPVVLSNKSTKICVIASPTIKGADCILTTDKCTSSTPQISPHEKSTWSSTSSIATRPNTDNPSSMSRVTTRFGTSKNCPHEDASKNYKVVGAPQFQNYPSEVGIELHSEIKGLSHNIKDSKREPPANDENDIKTFKSTAV